MNYNRRIQASDSTHDYLIFIHDDVWVDDFFLADHVIQGLDQFDIIGVAGNRRRLPNQPSWYFVDDQFTKDSNEHRPIHVHVRRGGGEAVFNVETGVELRESQGLKVTELARAEELRKRIGS